MACNPTITYKKEKDTFACNVIPAFQKELNPIICVNTKRTPKTRVSAISFRYFAIALSLNDFEESCKVILLAIIKAVLYQKA
jgi:hypothetical protein